MSYSAKAHFSIISMLYAYRSTAVALAALDTGILSRLSVVGSESASGLVSALGLDPESARRFLRALVVFEFVVQVADHSEYSAGLYELADLGHALIASPYHLRERALLTREQYLGGWSGLSAAIKSGGSGFEHEYGANVWEDRRRKPELQLAFTKLMQLNRSHVLSGTMDFPFEDYPLVVDVGGSDGTLLTALLERYPRMQTCLYDRPEVVTNVVPSERMRVTGGSFFDFVPFGGDLYILCHVLHDWPDLPAINILKNCRRLGTSVLVIEHTLSEVPTKDEVLRDLHMMAVTGGKERTRAEFETLFRRAGYEITRSSDLWMLLRPTP